ncbi:MAG: hypothetical protein R3B90_16500 [Planctomycetaceae bacterium]
MQSLSQLVLATLTLSLSLLLSGSGLAQEGRPSAEGGAAVEDAGPPTKSGKLTEVQQKGRTTTLILQMDDGQTHEVKVTPLISLAINGTGSKDLLEAGRLVSGTGIMSNNTIFLTEVTVHLLPKGRKAPTGGVQKIEAEAGESVNQYMVGGELTSFGPADGFPEYMALGLKLRGNVPNVWTEKEYTVKVSSADPEHAPVGSPVEVQYKLLRGGREMPAAIIVTREEPFTLDDVSEDE